MTTLLRDRTTIRLGGPAKRWVVAETSEDLIAAVRDADAAGEPVLLLSGGSNLVISDSGFSGTVVEVATKGVSSEGSFCEYDADTESSDSPTACGGFILTVEAGEVWDEVVAYAVDNELVGIEALSGIPGLTGSTPIQNVGAYGQEVSQVIWDVRTYDRVAKAVRTFASADCNFSYRNSRFKAEASRFVVLSIRMQLLQGSMSAPIRYGELARVLGVELGQRAPLRQVRDAVLGLRRGKGMLLDDSDHDTWSAGSFFTNPVIDVGGAELLPADAPRFPTADGRVKTSAAWLIEQAGFGRGYGTPPATLSTKHTLAITNRGGASSEDIVDLAREVRDGVRNRFGITLVPEPVLVGLSLDGPPA